MPQSTAFLRQYGQARHRLCFCTSSTDSQRTGRWPSDSRFSKTPSVAKRLAGGRRMKRIVKHGGLWLLIVGFSFVIVSDVEARPFRRRYRSNNFGGYTNYTGY